MAQESPGCQHAWNLHPCSGTDKVTETSASPFCYVWQAEGLIIPQTGTDGINRNRNVLRTQQSAARSGSGGMI